jgi:hypothetical protein
MYDILLDRSIPERTTADVVLDVPVGIALGDLAEMLAAIFAGGEVECISIFVGGDLIGCTSGRYLHNVFSPSLAAAGRAGSVHHFGRETAVRYRCGTCGQQIYRSNIDTRGRPTCYRDHLHGATAPQ